MNELPHRADVVLTFEIRSADPIQIPDDELTDHVADWLGRVTDNGPYPVSGDGDCEQTIRFGAVRYGGVIRVDGTAPPGGYHCGRCLDPKQEEGPCLLTVTFRSREHPCILDLGHHEQCRAARPRDARGERSADG